MLTPENPYGKNPPLKEEVMEALKHLKKLSESSTGQIYTSEQLDEIRAALGKNRPKWANSLALQLIRLAN